MKIIFTGGGSGGHFYPIIAVAQAINRIANEKHIIKPDLYFFAPAPYNEGILYDNGVKYKKTYAGKVRTYFSPLNFFDIFKTAWGTLSALLDVFDVYPDVVFGKGGFGSFPTLMAARLLRIPVVIHESDTVPGKANKWASKFARRIAISWQEAAEHFPKDRVAYTGQPIRRSILNSIVEGAHRFFDMEEGVPTILILGGSLGAEKLNDAVIDALLQLVNKYQVIHQTGAGNFEAVRKTADAVLLTSVHRGRYRPYPYLNDLEETMAAGAAQVILSRAGSTIFEIASWGRASIIVPITESNGNHQLKNAFAYASSGAATVVEENNLSNNILLSEIGRIVDNPDLRTKMEESAKNFFKPGADDKIARELLTIALGHEALD